MINLDDEFQDLNSRQLNPAQRRRLARVVQYVRKSNAYNGVTSVRFKISACKYFAAVSLKTRRSDCEKYSPRAIMCEWDLHFFIGPRGGLTLKRAECGFNNDSRSHLRKMLHCS